MQEEKSAVYTVILGICLLLCLLMLGNMLMGRADTGTAPAAPEEGDAMEFHITEDDIASVLIEALPFPVEDTAVKISRDGTIAVTAAVNRQALTESNLVPGKLRTALLFLPERCKLYGAWSAAVSNGKLSLACRTIKLEGFTLPEQAAQAVSDAFTAQWNTRHGTAGLHAADHTVAGRGSGAAGITALNRQKKNPFGKPKGFLVCNLIQKLRGLRPDSGFHSCRSATST